MMGFDTATLYNEIVPRYPELSGKTAIVTGSSKGIGKGIAIRLGREGMKVVLTSRTLADLQRLKQELDELGVETVIVQGNIGSSADIEKILSESLSTFGSVDVVVNNAANLKRVPFFNVSEEMIDNELAVNVKGPFLLSYKAAQVMRQSGGGSIIHISSVGGLRAHNPGLPYDATKGALDAMTRVMGIELAQYGIRVNGVAPGATYTEGRRALDDPYMVEVARRIPLNRFGLPLEIGAAVAFLASPEASYIIGQTIYVDGGITAQLSPPAYPV